MPIARREVTFNIVFPLVVLLVTTNLLASRTAINVRSDSHKNRDAVFDYDNFDDDEEGWWAPKTKSVASNSQNDRGVADTDAEGDDQDDDGSARHAMRHIPSNKRWHSEDTRVLSSISLPLWEDAVKAAREARDTPPSGVDRLEGIYWLPPRLPLSEELRARPYGVLFVGTGGDKYAINAMLPMIRYLRDTLGIPNAEERSRMSEGDGRIWQGFALVTSGKFIEEDGPLQDDALPFFDAVYVAEDELPSYPLDWEAWRRTDNKKTASLRKVARLKATKVRAMASSPFDTTIVLDFDSFPCGDDFGTPLLEMVGHSDMGLANVHDAMEDITDGRHYLGEHSSAVVVLNMTSVRTRMMLGLYVQSFLRQAEMREDARRDGTVFRGRERKQRDQPALKVAMHAMSGGFVPSHGEGDELEEPNKSVRDVIIRLGLGFLQHVDFSSSVLCRPSTSSFRVECGRESTCIVAHKARLARTENDKMEEEEEEEGEERDEEGENDNEEETDEEGSEVTGKEDTSLEEKAPPTKFFGLGFKKTGTTSLDKIFDHVMDRLGGSRPPGRKRVGALNELLRHNDTSPSIALAERYQYFQDAPWCNEPQRLYRRLARLHPTSKYILTIRDPDEWYDSVVRYTQCPPKKNGGSLCGKKKMDRYRAVFGAGGTSREDFTSAFESHNSAVREFFAEVLRQPDRLLEIDLTNEAHRGGAGWSIVCHFVGLSEADCPREDFPHENISV